MATHIEPADSVASVDIHEGECLQFLSEQEAGAFDLIYIDPPFNTGKRRVLRRTKTERVESGGDRTGFGGHRYQSTAYGQMAYSDVHADYQAFLHKRLEQAHRVLAGNGSLFLHLDPRESHYAKVALDRIFGRPSFINEIIWSYDYGARSRSRWSAKHDTILWYAKDPKHYTFRYEDIDRIPYMAPALVGEEKARRGKTPTDVWWNTIVSPTGKERTGYPDQKPMAILRRIIEVHSNPGDVVLDFFAGSGTTGEVASRLGRPSVLVDVNPDAVKLMTQRLAFTQPSVHGRGDLPTAGSG
jgi:site-specific DNA-methyltransferase (adenine-specific)